MEIVKMIKSNQKVAIMELDGFTEDQKKQILIAQKNLKHILLPSILFHNWTVAYSFFCDSIIGLLSCAGGIRTDYVIYQLKIVLNAGLEFIDTITRYMISEYPTSITKTNPSNKGDETHAEGAWIVKDLTATIYDNNFSYRLCYNLRNCLQHVGPEGVSIEHNEYGYKIILDQGNYANGHDGINGKFKKELLKAPDKKIDLVSMIHKYNKNISKLFENIEQVHWAKQMHDKLYSSLVIKNLLPCDDNEQIRYAILTKSNDTDTSDDLKCEIDYLLMHKAAEYVEMHCRYFVLRGSPVIDILENICPYQIDESTYNTGSQRFISNGMTYIKIDEKNTENTYCVIYILECLFPVERKAILEALKEYLKI